MIQERGDERDLLPELSTLPEEMRELLPVMREIIEDMSKAGITHLSLSLGDVELELSLSLAAEDITERQLSHESATSDVEEDERTVEIRSLLVGVYRTVVDPKEPIILREGMRVEKEQPLGAIEGLSFVQYLKSPVSGILKHIYVVDDQPVEYDQLLFEIVPDEEIEESHLDVAIAKLRRRSQDE